MLKVVALSISSSLEEVVDCHAENKKKHSAQETVHLAGINTLVFFTIAQVMAALCETGL